MSPQPCTCRVYVATGYARRHIAKSVMDELARRGFTITYDWTGHVEAELSDIEGRARIGEADLDGVRRADIVVILLPGGQGTHTELGVALGMNTPVLLVAADPDLVDNAAHPLPFYYAVGVTRLVGTAASLSLFGWLEAFRNRLTDDCESDSTTWG